VFSAAAAAMTVVMALMGMTAPQMATKLLLVAQPRKAAKPPTMGQPLMVMPAVKDW
jgi:hypothetical protein